ncbi:hypothetical protein G6F22_014066 [Rhizopus arrhizus]|nr:hypothetical protein G6F22_014066 [Rhizopus arrhizus]
MAQLGDLRDGKAGQQQVKHFTFVAAEIFAVCRMPAVGRQPVPPQRHAYDCLGQQWQRLGLADHAADASVDQGADVDAGRQGGEGQQGDGGERRAQQLHQRHAVAVPARQSEVDDGHIHRRCMQVLDERVAVAVAGNNAEAGVLGQVQCGTATDHFVIVQ